MQDFLSRPLSRRGLLAGALAAAATAVMPKISDAKSGPPEVIKVLEHDVIHSAAEFSRGRMTGITVRNAALEGDGLFESSIIESPFPFTHVGIHWRGNSQATMASMSVRTSGDGSQWSDWHDLVLEAGPDDTPAQENYGALVSTPRHSYLQFQAKLSGNASINKVTATFLNSKDGPAAVAALALTEQKPDCIDFSRREWGCDESLRFKGKKEIWPRMYVPVKKLILHHTVSGLYDANDAAAEVRAIYTYHAKTLGWGDIGYNALVDVYGRSYEGRYGRESGSTREVFSPDVVAGHVSAHNYGTCGVAAIADFEYGPLTPPEVMVNRIVDVMTFQATEREIDPDDASAFLKSDGTWSSDLINVCGHQDCMATLCPGKNLYPLLPSIRSAVTSRIESMPAPELAGPDATSQTGNTLSYTWPVGVGMDYSYYLEGWSKASSSENITYLTGYDAARYPLWSPWGSYNSASFSGLAGGHYSIHVRSRDSSGRTSYQGNRTVLLASTQRGRK